MDSSSSKRKRRAGGRSEEPRLPSRPRGGGDAHARNEVSDAEVEEFYTILRRMRDASRCLADGTNASPAAAPAAAPADGGKDEVRWSPAFAWEDFATDAVKDDGVRAKPPAEVVEKPAPRRFDLNTDPEPEGIAVASPRGESTARCSSAQA